MNQNQSEQGVVPAKKKQNVHFSNTEGNEALNPDVGMTDSNASTINMLNRRAPMSEFEPKGSQDNQYNGQFVTHLPPMANPEEPELRKYEAPVVQNVQTEPNLPNMTRDLEPSESQRFMYNGALVPMVPNVQEPPPDGGPQDDAPSRLSWIPYYDFTQELMAKYDRPFVILLGIQNVNHGLWTVAVLACQDLYKQYLKLDPGQMTMYMSLIHIPWSIKIVYGLISDNVPIAGTRRKSYIIIMGMLQFFALIAIYFLNETSAISVAVLLTLAALSEAFVNVVADAIMCIQARKDPEHGSQDLISFSWLATGVGGILGCIIGGLMTQNCHPRYSFMAYSFMGLTVALNGMYLTRESEEDEVVDRDESSILTQEDIAEEGQESRKKGFCYKLGKNMKQIGEAMMMREIVMVIGFFLLNGLLSPDFGDFSYYFMLNVVKLSKFQYSMLGTVGQVTSVFGTMYYEYKLKDVEVRSLLYYSTIFSLISSMSQYAFALRLNVLVGIPDVVFIILTDTIFGVISLAMNTLPTLALFAKITPKKIEGTVFAFLTGTTNLANNVLAPMVGVWINEKFVGVTADDLSNYKNLCFVGIITSVLGFFILPLIPLKEQIVQYQEEREKAAAADGNKQEKPQAQEEDVAVPINELDAETRAQILKGKKPEQDDNINDNRESNVSSNDDLPEIDDILQDDETKPLVQ